MRKVVVNTTPLIALSHVDRMDILKKMYGEKNFGERKPAYTVEFI
jgi:predicted nucleic acid-binding protein